MHTYRFASFVVVCLTLVTALPCRADVVVNGTRTAISLNGAWESLPIHGFTFSYPPPATGWGPVSVPCNPDQDKAVESPNGPYRQPIRDMLTKDGKDFKRHDKIAAWYRRSFAGPAAPIPGQRAILHFDGVAFKSTTWFNGKILGDWVIGEVPHDFDVTTLVKYGQPNELVVGVAGREAIVDLASKSYIAPAGGVMTGIWGGVSLQFVPVTSIDDVFVKTSFRNKSITLDATVANTMAKPRVVIVDATVVDAHGEPQCAFAPQTVTVSPNTSSAVTLSKDWIAPRLWSPETPIMYYAQVRLREGAQVLDQSSQRFGFREFWIEGRDFYLNGVKTVLRRNSMLTHLGAPPEGIEREIRNTAGRPFNAMRLHIGFDNSDLLDATDRFGVMTMPELAWYNIGDDYDLAHTDTWLPNLLEYERRLIKLHRSRPSIVIWNLTNETFWDDTSPGNMKIADALLSMAKAMDPTRPQEGDAEITWGGRLPIISIHYPEGTAGVTRVKYPDSGIVVPNDFYWLPKDPNEMAHSWRADFKWDRPLMIGEFWDTGFNFDERSAFMGEEAYDWERWRLTDFSGRDGKGPNTWNDMVTKMTDVYRMQGVAGMNPWSGDRPTVFPSVVVRALEFHPNFYAGKTTTRKVVVINDTNATYGYPGLQCRLTVNGVTAWEKTIGLDVRAGSTQAVDIPIECPNVTEQTKAQLTVRFRCEMGGNWYDLSRYDETIYVVPAARWSAPKDGIALLDTTGATTKALSAVGLDLTPHLSVTAADLATARVLVIGAGTDPTPFSAAIQKFVEKGGRVVMLSASNSSALSPDMPEIDTKHVASRVWLRTHGSSALAGLEEPQFQHWQSDNIVSTETAYIPSSGNCKIFLDAGGLYGMKWTPLMEVAHGQGSYLVSTLNLIDKAGIEPAADRLLVSLIGYASSEPAPHGLPLRLLAGDNAALKQALATCSVVVSAGLSGNGPVLVDGSYKPTADEIAKLKAYLADGGSVWLHGFTPDIIGNVAGLFPAAPKLVEIDKTVQACARRSDDPWMDGLSSYDFAWTRVNTGARGDYFAGAQSTASIGKYVFVPATWDSATILTAPAVLAKVRTGKGAVLVDTLPWENAFGPELDKAIRVTSALTLNLGGDIQTEPAKSYSYFNVDIASKTNRGYYDEVAGDGKGGWTDQGENDMRYFLIDHKGKVGDMDVVTGNFPAQATFADRPFALVNPKANGGKAVVTLRGQGHDPAAPASVTGIAVGHKADKLWFLESACWAVSGNFNEVLGRYTIHYEDGTTADFRLREGVELTDWWDPKPLPGSRVGWSGRNPMHAPVGMYVTEWTNPNPDKTIASVDLEGNLAEAQIVLVGITGGVESTSGGEAAAHPVAAWDFGAVKDGVIPNLIPGVAPLKYFTYMNPPQPIAVAGGVKFAHGSSVEGSVKGLAGIADATPWTLNVDLTVDEKPDGYCGGIFQAMDYLKAGLRLVVGENLKLTTEIYEADGKGRYLTSSAPLTPGRDYKVRIVFDGQKATMYLNNHLDAVVDSPVPDAWAGGLQVGVAGGNKYNFNGVVRSLSIVPGG